MTHVRRCVPSARQGYPDSPMEPWLTRAARIHGNRVALRTAAGAQTTYAEL